MSKTKLISNEMIEFMKTHPELSSRQVSNVFGCSIRSVLYYRKKAGFPTQSNFFVTRHYAVNNFIEDHPEMTVQELAKTLGIAEASVIIRWYQIYNNGILRHKGFSEYINDHPDITGLVLSRVLMISGSTLYDSNEFNMKTETISFSKKMRIPISVFLDGTPHFQSFVRCMRRNNILYMDELSAEVMKNPSILYNVGPITGGMIKNRFELFSDLEAFYSDPINVFENRLSKMIPDQYFILREIAKGNNRKVLCKSLNKSDTWASSIISSSHFQLIAFVDYVVDYLSEYQTKSFSFDDLNKLAFMNEDSRKILVYFLIKDKLL